MSDAPRAVIRTQKQIAKGTTATQAECDEELQAVEVEEVNELLAEITAETRVTNRSII